MGIHKRATAKAARTGQQNVVNGAPPTHFGSNQAKMDAMRSAQQPTGTSQPQQSTPVTGPVANGCGSETVWGSLALGNAMFPEFREACNIHDVGDASNPGYGTVGATKEQADQNFLNNMNQVCETEFGDDSDELAQCNNRASMLFNMVDNYGDEAFTRTQAEATAFSQANRGAQGTDKKPAGE